MKRYLNVFLLLVSVFMLSSCTLYQQIPIEVLRTEEVVFPSKSNALAFVYRNFKFNKDTLQNRYIEDGELKTDRRTGKNETDSLVVMACLNAVASVLKEKGVCDQPVFYPFDIFPPQQGERIVPLPEELIKKMAKPAKADYLVVLETITYFFTRYSEGIDIIEYQNVPIAAVWNVYNGSTGKIEDHKTTSDTLYWDDQPEGTSGQKTVMPPRLVSLQQAGAILGENYAKRFYSEWEKVERMLIIPPLEDFRQAAAYADQQDWNKAAAIWNKYTAEKFGKLAISACYNLALSEEIRDNLRNAKEWADLAVKLAKSYKGSDELTYALRYREIINDRILRIEKSEKYSPK